MKFFKDKQLNKVIILILIFTMSYNFIIPNHVQAISGDQFGGALFKPISQLLCKVGDLVIGGLQKYFLGDGEIEYGINEIKSATYNIRYSPGIIFSGGVPGLDVNFINPNFQGNDSYYPTKVTATWNKLDSYNLESDKDVKELTEKYGFDKNNVDNVEMTTNTEWYKSTFGVDKDHVIKSWINTNTGKSYKLISTLPAKDQDTSTTIIHTISTVGTVAIPREEFWITIDNLLGNGWTLYELEENTTISTEKIESSAKTLQSTVATWYKALRAIALVGLLSVLVYIGIRMILSSTSQEKAKYKNMIKDWVVAICILFILQYIMVFTLEITEKIIEILKQSVVAPDGTDSLMTNLRNTVALSNDFSKVFPETLMYVVLVIYTVVFTLQYLKRLLYMAFFTMIAPLIALTYPLDKIKDGQAQAFTTWVREYVFNALIQPVHLLLYYIFVSSASSLVESNPLYAVVAIGFLIPAEKFFRRMFGFDKASSVSQVGAAAGGALIMNAINKMGHRSGKQASGKETGGSGSSSGGRTRTPSANAGTIGVGDEGGISSAGNGSSTASSGGKTGELGTERSANTHGATMANALGQKKSIKNGVSAVRRKYLNKNTAKKVGRMARKGLIGAAGAATLGSVGLAAGISTGDLGNVFKYGAAGVGAGYMGANYVGDNLLSGEKNIRETFKEGAIGQNEYNNLKLDKEFYESDEFRNMLNDRSLEIKDKNGNILKGHERTKEMRNAIQVYRDNGITDTNKIKAAMKSNLSPQEGAYAVRLAEMIGRSGWNNPKTREDFKKRYSQHMPAGADANRIWNSIEDLL